MILTTANRVYDAMWPAGPSPPNSRPAAALSRPRPALQYRCRHRHLIAVPGRLGGWRRNASGHSDDRVDRDGPATEQPRADAASSGRRSPENASEAPAAIPVVEPSYVLSEAQLLGEAGQAEQLRDDEQKEQEIQAKARERLNRKAALILDLMKAGEQVESMIDEHWDEIDELLLKVLYKRIEAASSYETTEVVSRLEVLFHRLRRQVERNQATPALRLLDDLLDVITQDDVDYEDREEEIVEKLEQAFTPGGSATDIDVFGMAADLASRGEEAGDSYVESYVPQAQFCEEVQKLVEETLDRCEDFERLVTQQASRQAQLREGAEGAAAELQLVEQEVVQQRVLVNHVQDILRLARQIECWDDQHA